VIDGEIQVPYQVTLGPNAKKATKGRCVGIGTLEPIPHYSLRYDLSSLMGIGAVLMVIYCQGKFCQIIP
jgi:hypothetical protein